MLSRVPVSNVRTIIYQNIIPKYRFVYYHLFESSLILHIIETNLSLSISFINQLLQIILLVLNNLK